MFQTHPWSPWRAESAVAVQRDLFTFALSVKQLFAKFEYIDISLNDDTGPDQFLALHSDKRIVFSNPYRDRETRLLYQHCRANSHPYVVIERGALPDTVIIDSSGFLMDSTAYEKSYIQEEWLPDNWRREVQDVRTKYFSNNRPLEIQPKKPPELLKNPDNGKPTILIALQQPEDTVTRFFAREGEDYSTFLILCASIVRKLGTEYNFWVKSHPRAPHLSVEGAQVVNSHHIDDVLAKCDAVLTFNSGVGILSMVHGNPVATFGRAFYNQADSVVPVTDIQDVTDFLESVRDGWRKGEVDPFLFHLTNRIYSDVRFLPENTFTLRQKVAISQRQFRIYDGSKFHVGPPVGVSRYLIDAVELVAAVRRFIANRLGF